jgi:hypothetical protein
VRAYHASDEVEVAMESAGESRPPARPRTDEELKFKPADSVQWFAPSVLRDSALQLGVSLAFGAFLDKRELQANAVDVDPTPPVFKDDVWFDFISDTGDGFDATYTVAWLAGKAELKPINYDGDPLPRGQLLILGGDEVYPVGSPEAYENRFVGPFEASVPWIDPENTTMWAIPGNHDWYDGLTSFFRVFCQDRWIGGRRTCQSRSYFAIQLPAGWWIWGIDIQLDSYIDEPQKRYFLDQVKLQAGDKVILCTGKPSWYDGREARGYKNLEFVEKELINERGGHLVVSLTGDSHHYAHYRGTADGTHKITAGGGGAFLHPTHVLEKRIRLPMGRGDDDQVFELTACYPEVKQSRKMTWSALALPRKNPSFMIVPGVMYMLVALANQASLLRFAEGEGPTWRTVVAGLVQNPLSGLILVVFFFGLMGFAKPDERWPVKRRKKWKWIMGAAHLLMHFVAVCAVLLLAAKVSGAVTDQGIGFTLLLLLLVFIVGGPVGSLVMGLYLALSCRAPFLKAHGNEAFSAMRNPDYKNFLRLHLDTSGALTVFPIGIRKAGTAWRCDPDNDERSAAWLAPAGEEPVAHLIEDPFTIRVIRK